MVRAKEESAEAIVVKRAVERRKEQRAEEPRKSTGATGSEKGSEKNCETAGALQLRQPPRPAHRRGGDGMPGNKGARRASHRSGGGSNQTMLNERNTEAATLAAVLVPENLQVAWLSVKANGGAADYGFTLPWALAEAPR